MKKRCSAFFLALVLCVGLAVPAFAETGSSTVISSSLEYTLEQQGKNGSSPFIAQEIILDSDSNPPHSGYYAITEDAAWTISNTDPEDVGVLISFSERCKESDHYSTRNICWIMPDGTFSLAYKGIDQEKLILKSGQSVTFSLKDALSAMEVTADPAAVYEIQLLDSIYRDYIDRNFFRLDSSADPGAADKRPTSSPSFTDVLAGEYYAAPVAWAVEKGITNGTSDTTFSPGQDCTQAQILTFLYRAIFHGTPSSADMDNAVAWAREKDMIGDGFNGAEPCTRATAVDYIWRAFGMPEAASSSFTDVDTDTYYAAAVDWAVANGITKGTSDTTFSPDQVCNRGQIVTFLHRAYAG